jgi:hypothetical protein
MATAPILTATVTVLSNGSPVKGFTNLPVETMTLTEDRKASQRARLSATFSPTGLVPTDLSDVLAPNGNELLATAGWQGDGGGDAR